MLSISNRRNLIPLRQLFNNILNVFYFRTWTSSQEMYKFWYSVELVLIWDDSFYFRKVRHQNIVTFYGFSAGDGNPGKSLFVFTELCDKTLKDEIFRGESSWRSRQRYLEDALKGLEYLHHYGIVHKNIRLTTILVSITYKTRRDKIFIL